MVRFWVSVSWGGRFRVVVLAAGFRVAVVVAGFRVVIEVGVIVGIVIGIIISVSAGIVNDVSRFLSNFFRVGGIGSLYGIDSPYIVGVVVVVLKVLIISSVCISVYG